jgi:hypothetical protein
MHTAKLAASLLVLLALIVGAAPARAETVNCTPITGLPAVITKPGVYCFTGDLVTDITSDQAIIEISAHNVVLDLNGFKLGGLPAGPGTFAVGIFAFDRQNITIKNGTVRGFLRGIFLTDNGASQGHVVEDIRADQNTFVGIDVEGSGTIIRNNQVVATGGTTVNGPETFAYGIIVLGDGLRVLNNDVIHTVKQGTGIAWGILFTGVSGGLAVNNRITGADRGIEFAINNTGKYRDNLTFDVPTATRFVGGTDAGNNN